MDTTALGMAARRCRASLAAAIAAAAFALLLMAAPPAVAEAPGDADAALESGLQAQEAAGYTVPVKMLKASSDSASMAAPVLHPTAFAQEADGGYLVTIYLVNAQVMGSTIFSGSLGDATYDKAGDGTLAPVEDDFYDASTQVRAVKLALAGLDAPVTFHMSMFMDNVRLSFDAANMQATDVPPSFPKVAISSTAFPADSTRSLGGSGDDSANAMDRFANGTIVVAGDTDSTDQDFSGHADAVESPYLALCSPEGEVLSANYLSGADSMGIWDVSAGQGGAYFAAGMFQMREGAAGGDFEGLTMDGTEGSRNGFVAKYANGKRQWARSVCSSQAAQFNAVQATPDGGCIAVGEMLRGASPVSDFADEVKGIVNTFVVKYASDGAEEWHKVLTAGPNTIVDANSAVVQEADGSYLVAGMFANAAGDMEGAARFGGTFDLCVVSLDADGQVASVYSYGGSADNENIEGLAATADGGFIAVGSTSSTDGTFEGCDAQGANGFVLKCAADGSVQWRDVFRSTKGNKALGVAELAGGFAVVGQGEGSDYDFTNISKGQYDAFAATYDAAGHRLGLHTFGGSKNDYVSDVVALDGGQYLFFAESNSTDSDLAGIARGGDDGVLVCAGNTTDEDMERRADEAAAAVVEGLLRALPEPADVTADDADAIAEARGQFDALSAGATALVPADLVKKLQQAEAALAKPADADEPAPAEEAPAVKKGGSYEVGGSTYKVAKLAKGKAAGAVTLTAAKSAKSVSVPASVKLADGKSYAVTAVAKGAFAKSKATKATLGKNVAKLAAGAFKGSKVKTLVLKTKKLAKKSAVKGSLKSSKVSTVQVKVGSKKQNKAYAKKYAKAFTKANAGKKPAVK